jgi:hypothetical protein
MRRRAKSEQGEDAAGVGSTEPEEESGGGFFPPPMRQAQRSYAEQYGRDRGRLPATLCSRSERGMTFGPVH